MTRKAQAKQDETITRLLRRGMAPKEVAARLKLKNKWHVYNVRRRFGLKAIYQK